MGPEGSEGRPRRLGGFLVLVLIVAGVAVFYRLHSPQHDYYQAVRTALSDARMHLSQSYAHEKALMEELGAAQREFETVIGLLKAAEEQDPANRERIAQIERDLESLRTAAEHRAIGPDELQSRYQELQSRLDGLLRENR